MEAKHFNTSRSKCLGAAGLFILIGVESKTLRGCRILTPATKLRGKYASHFFWLDFQSQG